LLAVAVPVVNIGISVDVKAKVVNWKQMDVEASRSFRLSWNALIAHCTRG